MNLIGTGQYQERIKLYLPSYTRYHTKYRADNTNGIIVLPLFQAWHGINPDYHINSAFWVYHSFLVNSNIADMGIPVRFYVEDKVWQMQYVKEMFREANIPFSMVWTFQRTPTETIWRYYLGQKLSCLWDERFNDYGNVLVWDTDLFVACSTANRLDVTTLFRREHPTQPAGLHVQPDARKEFRFNETHDTTDSEHCDYLSKSITKELTGEEYDRGYAYSIGGCLHSFCPGQIQPGFIDFYQRALPLIGDDEMIVSFWSTVYDEVVESLDPIVPPLAYEVEHLHTLKESGNPFLCHLWTQSVQSGNDIQDWKACIGVQKYWGVSRTHTMPMQFPVGDDIPEDRCIPDVAVLNLPRRTDRLEGFTLQMRQQGFKGYIHVFEGVDSQDYESADDVVREAMYHYPGFEELLGHDVSWAAHQHSMLKVMAWIMGRTHPVLLFEDDTALRSEFAGQPDPLMWEKFLDSFNQLPPDFNIAMLNYNHIVDKQYRTLSYALGWEIGAKSNGTTANVFSPAGAAALFEQIKLEPATCAEFHIPCLDIEGIFSAVPVLASSYIWDSDITPEHNTGEIT